MLSVLEPYVCRAQVLSCPGIRWFTGSSGVGAEIASCVGLVGNRCGCYLLSNLFDSHCVAVEVFSGSFRCIVVSIYCQFRNPIRPYLDRLDRILRSFDSSIPLLICGDFNARSRLWFSERFRFFVHDVKGSAVEDFLAVHDFSVLNVDGTLSTHEGPWGHSNVDVCMGNAVLFRHDPVWHLKDELLADHCLMVVSLSCVVADPASPRRAPLLLRDGDWILFDCLLCDSIPDLRHEDPSVFAGCVNDCLMRVSSEAVPVPSPHDKFNCWWSSHLGVLRLELCRLRKRFQRTHAPALRSARHCEYISFRSFYYFEIRRRCWDCWVCYRYW